MCFIAHAHFDNEKGWGLALIAPFASICGGRGISAVFYNCGLVSDTGVKCLLVLRGKILLQCLPKAFPVTLALSPRCVMPCQAESV